MRQRSAKPAPSRSTLRVLSTVELACTTGGGRGRGVMPADPSAELAALPIVLEGRGRGV